MKSLRYEIIAPFVYKLMGSTITDLSQVSYVLAGIPNLSGTPTLTLIYRASRDGWNQNDFHRLCDGKGPTVSFVRSSKGSLCAGYAKIPWKNSGGE